MRSLEIEAYKRGLKLTDEQRSILVGLLLGDGHLETQNGRKTYRLKIEHAAKQRFYTDWLYEQLKEWVRTPVATKTKHLNGKELSQDWFQTLSVSQFRFYGLQFYDSAGKKCVPKLVRKLLSPLALAVWFMDDGSAKSNQHQAVILNSHCFSRREIGLLQTALQTRYQIESTIRTQKDGLQVLISGSNAQKFKKIVEPYILPDFMYKFGALVNTLPKRYRRRSKVS